jgi:hypothetical protein
MFELFFSNEEQVTNQRGQVKTVVFIVHLETSNNALILRHSLCVHTNWDFGLCADCFNPLPLQLQLDKGNADNIYTLYIHYRTCL